MKEIKEQIKHEVVEEYTHYQAIDGTKFETKEECKKYEESALGVMRGRLSKMIVSDRKNAWDLMGGYDDHSVVAVALKQEEDVNNFLQWLYLEAPWYLNESMKGRKKQVEDIVYTAYSNQDLVLLGINCDNEYYFINSRNNIINNLNNVYKYDSKNNIQE